MKRKFINIVNDDGKEKKSITLPRNKTDSIKRSKVITVVEDNDDNDENDDNDDNEDTKEEEKTTPKTTTKTTTKIQVSARLNQRLKRTCKCSSRVACVHFNLALVRPDLVEQWHPDNKKAICEYLPMSQKKVKWKCSNNKSCTCPHVWEATIGHRTWSGSNCPFCSGRKKCACDTLEAKHPHLQAEWHEDNRPMCEYSPGSRDIVKWRCARGTCSCTHVWTTRIVDRTGSKPRGCPFCANLKLCNCNHLEAKHPELKIEWHPDNKAMNTYHHSSYEKVLWICSRALYGCPHIWVAAIDRRTRTTLASGCPFCANRKLCSCNNLEAQHPNLKAEWHPDNVAMNTLPPGSDRMVRWICAKRHEWSAVVHQRTGQRAHGCPHCAHSKSYSNAQIKWLKEIEIKDHISIRNALSAEGEFKIPTIGKVDGYHKETKTVYEYHGDYWHGNPSHYAPYAINPTVKKKYGDLYNQTLARDARIRKLGYRLIVKWETDLPI